MSDLNLPRIVIAQEIIDDRARTIRDIQQEAHRTAKDHGFSFDNIPQQAMMIVTEVSEFVQELRAADRPFSLAGPKVKMKLAEELADIVIRTCSLSEHMGLDLGAAINQKMHDNKSREYLHGRAF